MDKVRLPDNETLSKLGSQLDALAAAEKAWDEGQRHSEEELQEQKITHIREYVAAMQGLYDKREEWEYKAFHLEEDLEKKRKKSQTQFLDELNKKRAEAYEQAIKKEEKNKGTLSDEDKKKIEERIVEEFKIQEKQYDKWLKKKEELDKKQKEKEVQDQYKGYRNTFIGKGHTWDERKEALRDLTTFEQADGSREFNFKLALTNFTNLVGDLAKQLDNKVDEIGSHKGAIDTRLQGSKNKNFFGSYWDRMSWDITGATGMSPIVKQESIVSNLSNLVNRGIAFNVEQRAFLATIKDKIATTFDATDATLLKLIRLQQQDSTAARLGMESAMTAFLNSMYETSEYMTDAAASVRGSLGEMESLMSTKAATEVEFQVQKWLGSLYSVGMSNSVVTSIADAFGKLAAGDISGLTNGGTGNLMIMAANQAGLPISDLLANGVNASDTNLLMQAMVNYLAGIGSSSAGNNVVQQQLASVYGLKASDLRAIQNLADKGTMKSVTGTTMSYGNMMSQLGDMTGSMWRRTSIGEMAQNLWGNTQYMMAANIANNPVFYGLMKAATLLDNLVGGISIPTVMAMGTGVDLNTTVADIMRTTAFSGSILSSMGSMVSGLVNNGAGLLNAFGINSGITSVNRGTSNGLGVNSVGGATVSESGYVGNANGGDVLDSTMANANDSKKEQANAAEEESDIKNRVINDNVVKIYDQLQRVIDGTARLHIKLDRDETWTNPLSIISGL